MSKFSTLNFLVNSYYSGTSAVHSFPADLSEVSIENDLLEMEPSKKSIEAILRFAAQYEVLKSEEAGNIELNLN